MNSFISLGDHEISHGEISPGYQENLLVNKFPVLTPPLISVLVVLVVNSFISLGDHEISHGEISHGHQENLTVRILMVTKRNLTVRFSWFTTWCFWSKLSLHDVHAIFMSNPT